MEIGQEVKIEVAGMTTGIFKGYHISPLDGERTGVYVKYESKNPPMNHGWCERGVALFSMGTISPITAK